MHSGAPMDRTSDPAWLLADQRWLAALARSLVHDEQAAEDVVQETRLRAWRKPPGDLTHAGAFLRRIARNFALHMLRGEARRERREREAAAPEAQPASDELVARVEMQRAVADAVLALAEPYRSVVLLRFFERLPPREIAERMQAPVDTVRTRLKRALEQLRARLDRDFGARDAWAGLLIPWFGGAKGLAAGAAATGGVVTMSAGAKLAVAAALVAAAGVATWEWRRAKPANAANAANALPAAANTTSGSDGGGASARPDGAPTATPLSPARTVEAPRGAAATSTEFEHVHLTARIVDETTRAPLTAATLVVFYSSNHRLERTLATSDRDGRVILDFGPMARWDPRYEVHHADHAALSDFVKDVPTESTDMRLERDLGDIALERGTALAGRIVRLPERAPVADAPLFVIGSRLAIFNQFWPDSAFAAGRSRADGSFELTERIGSNVLVPTVYAVTPTGAGYTIFSLTRGRDRIDDLVIEIEPTAELEVRVRNPDGSPFPNARIAALPRFSPLGPMAVYHDPFPPRFDHDEWRSLFSGTTDRDGRLELRFLPEGRGDTHLQQWSGYFGRYTVFASAEKCRTAFGEVSVRRGERASVDLVLRTFAPLVVRGRVSCEGNAAVAGAEVVLEGLSATTDEAGLYEVPPIADDREHLSFHVRAEGLGPIEQELFVSKLGDRLVPVRGADGVVEREEVVVDFALSRALSVAGRCIDASGQAVSRVGVSLSRYDELHRSWIRRNSASGDDGRFQVEGVVAGDWTLDVSVPDGFRAVARRTVAAGTSDIEVKLLRSPMGRARLVATVVDPATGQPVDVSSAVLFPKYWGNSGKSARCAVGSVTADGLSVGAWRLSIKGASGARLNRDFEVTDADQEVELRLELGANASFDGRVTLADGSPLQPNHPRMMVWLLSSNYQNDCGHAVDAEGRRLSNVTDACANVEEDGTFRIADVTAGSVISVRLSSEKLAADATILLAPGEHRHVELRLQPAGSVAFRLDEVLASGRIIVETSRAGGIAVRIAQQDGARLGDVLRQDEFSSGPLHWSASYVPEDEVNAVPRVVEGDLDVVAGKEQLVAIRGFK